MAIDMNNPYINEAAILRDFEATDLLINEHNENNRETPITLHKTGDIRENIEAAYQEGFNIGWNKAIKIATECFGAKLSETAHNVDIHGFDENNYLYDQVNPKGEMKMALGDGYVNALYSAASILIPNAFDSDLRQAVDQDLKGMANNFTASREVKFTNAHQ